MPIIQSNGCCKRIIMLENNERSRVTLALLLLDISVCQLDYFSTTYIYVVHNRRKAQELTCPTLCISHEYIHTHTHTCSMACGMRQKRASSNPPCAIGVDGLHAMRAFPYYQGQFSIGRGLPSYKAERVRGMRMRVCTRTYHTRAETASDRNVSERGIPFEIQWYIYRDIRRLLVACAIMRTRAKQQLYRQRENELSQCQIIAFLYIDKFIHLCI